MSSRAEILKCLGSSSHQQVCWWDMSPLLAAFTLNTTFRAPLRYPWARYQTLECDELVTHPGSLQQTPRHPVGLLEWPESRKKKYIHIWTSLIKVIERFHMCTREASSMIIKAKIVNFISLMRGRQKQPLCFIFIFMTLHYNLLSDVRSERQCFDGAAVDGKRLFLLCFLSWLGLW